MRASRHHAIVLGLYASTVTVVVTLLAVLFVVPMAHIGYASVVALLMIFSTAAIDFETRPRQVLWLSPLGVALAVAGPAMVVAQYEQPIRMVVDDVSTIALQAGASVLGLTALVLVVLPVLVHRHAWTHVDEFTENRATSVEAVSERFAADGPERVEIRTLDHPKPAVSLFDDGRDAVIAFTTGADDVLDDREREALTVRELTRVVERDAVPSFWASALALGVAELVEPVIPRRYAARAGDTVRLPFWFVAPLKIAATVAAILLVFFVPIWTLSVYGFVSGPMLLVACTFAAMCFPLGLVRATASVARYAATVDVLVADETGAILANDATALASALRTLDEAHAEGDGEDETDGLPDALDVLTQCPTERIPVEDRLDALDDVADRLDERPQARPADATAASASS